MKNIKRVLATIMCVVMVLTAAPLSGYAGLKIFEYLDFGVEAEAASVYHHFDSETGTLFINGSGYMSDYTASYQIPWDSYSDKIYSVVIADGIKDIGNCSFFTCNNLTSVVIPDSVTRIGDLAFSHCRFKSITIPNSVKKIGSSAFNNTALTSIVIPDSVTSIGASAFAYSYNLESVTIGNGVTTLENAVFKNCSKLTSVKFGDNIESFGDRVFQNCKSLKVLTIPCTLWSIGEDVFDGCNELEEVIFNEGARRIPSNFLVNCKSLTNITIPLSLVTIESCAFLYSSNLEKVYYAGSEEQWKEIYIAGGIAFDEQTHDIINYIPLSDVTIIYNHPHDYKLTEKTDATCELNGEEVLACSCGKNYSRVITAKGHVWGEWKTTLEPTSQKEGIKERKCTVCGEVQTQLIPDKAIHVKLSDFKMYYRESAKLYPDELNLIVSHSSIEYISSDPSVVQIDWKGNMYAVGEGEAEITVIVKSDTGRRAEDTCKVTVEKVWWQWLIIIFLFGWIWY